MPHMHMHMYIHIHREKKKQWKKKQELKQFSEENLQLVTKYSK